MKTLIIIFLILLVLGLYYVPGITKSAMKATGHAVLKIIDKGLEEIKETKTYENITKTMKENISNNSTIVK